MAAMTACPLSRDPAVRCVYTRRQLLGLRRVPGSKSKVYVNEVAMHGLLRYRGNRAGLETHRRQGRVSIYKHDPGCQLGSVQAVHSRWQSCSRYQQHHRLCGDRSPSRRDSTLITVSILTPLVAHQAQPPVSHMPSVYVLNAAALSKPGAVQHLAADLQSYDVSVAVITETHFKSKHTDSTVGVEGYKVYRLDRTGRRGGGVAVYVTAEMQSSRWTSSEVADSSLEIEWVRVGESVFIAALYHPPRPTYKLEVLLDYIEASVAELSHDFPLADIVVAGDVNQLSDRDIVERTGLTQIVCQPTRGANTLDKIYVSSHSSSTRSEWWRRSLRAIIRPSSRFLTVRVKCRRPTASTYTGGTLQHSAPTSFSTPPVRTSQTRARRPVPTRRSTHRQSSTIFIRSQCNCSTSTTRSKSSL